MPQDLTYVQKMNKMSIEDMWFLIDEVLPRYDDFKNRDMMTYEQVFQLFTIVRKSHHLFQILAQSAVLKKAVKNFQWLQTQN